jgi:CheY-like chemotaxis protein
MPPMPVQNKIQSLAPAILIVDDNPQNLQVLGRILLENGYKIEFSTSGKAALNWLKTKPGEIKKEKINLSNLINEMLDEEKEKFKPGNIQIKRNYVKTPGLITGEAELIKKCIGNILNNAVRFGLDINVNQ